MISATTALQEKLLHTIRMKSLSEISCNGESNSSVSLVTLSYQAKICWGNPQEEGKGLWNSFQLRWLSGSEGTAAEEQKETRKWCQQLPSVHERHSSHLQQQWPEMKEKFQHWAKENKGISKLRYRGYSMGTAYQSLNTIQYNLFPLDLVT